MQAGAERAPALYPAQARSDHHNLLGVVSSSPHNHNLLAIESRPHSGNDSETTCIINAAELYVNVLADGGAGDAGQHDEAGGLTAARADLASLACEVRQEGYLGDPQTIIGALMTAAATLNPMAAMDAFCTEAAGAEACTLCTARAYAEARCLTPLTFQYIASTSLVESLALGGVGVRPACGLCGAGPIYNVSGRGGLSREQRKCSCWLELATAKYWGGALAYMGRIMRRNQAPRAALLALHAVGMTPMLTPPAVVPTRSPCRPSPPLSPLLPKPPPHTQTQTSRLPSSR
jgi:hypothetical protein